MYCPPSMAAKRNLPSASVTAFRIGAAASGRETETWAPETGDPVKLFTCPSTLDCARESVEANSSSRHEVQRTKGMASSDELATNRYFYTARRRVSASALQNQPILNSPRRDYQR